MLPFMLVYMNECVNDWIFTFFFILFMFFFSQVLRGGDTNAGFYINDPTGQAIMPYQWKQHAEFDDEKILKGGYT